MFSQRKNSITDYEQALTEIIEIQSSDAPVNLGRLEELTALIDSCERNIWTDNMFANFDTEQLN